MNASILTVVVGIVLLGVILLAVRYAVGIVAETSELLDEYGDTDDGDDN